MEKTNKITLMEKIADLPICVAFVFLVYRIITGLLCKDLIKEMTEFIKELKDSKDSTFKEIKIMCMIMIPIIYIAWITFYYTYINAVYNFINHINTNLTSWNWHFLLLAITLVAIVSKTNVNVIMEKRER